MNLAAAVRWNALATAVLAVGAGVALWFAVVDGPPDTRADAGGAVAIERPALMLARADWEHAVAGKSKAASRVKWTAGGDSVELLHARIAAAAGRENNGLQRGRDTAELLGGRGNPDAVRGAWADAEKSLQRDHPAMRRVVDDLMRAAGGSMSSGGRISTLWPDDVIAESLGLATQAGGEGVAVAARSLAAASEVEGGISGSAVALPAPGGPILVATFSTKLPLTPMMIEAADGTAVFMLGVAGMSMPVCGMNSRGLAIVRFAPQDTGDNYVVGFGPDTAAQCRDFLLRLGQAGMEPFAKDGSNTVGAMLASLSEPQEFLINRHATPGVVLAADAREAWRYEWKAVGNDEDVSCGFEFAALAGSPLLSAGSRYQSPELRGKDELTESALARRAREMLGFDHGDNARGDAARLTPELVATLMQAGEGEWRVALHPAAGVVYFDTGDGVVAVPLRASAR